MKKLINKIEIIAKENYGGHYTIFRFTTNYKASFGTITEREDIYKLKPFKDLKECLKNLIKNESKTKHL